MSGTSDIIEVRQGDHANLTYCVTVGDRELVVRRSTVSAMKALLQMT